MKWYKFAFLVIKFEELLKNVYQYARGGSERFGSRYWLPIKKKLTKRSKLSENALLVLYCTSDQSSDLRSKDGRIQIMSLPTNSSSLFQPMNQNIAQKVISLCGDM